MPLATSGATILMVLSSQVGPPIRCEQAAFGSGRFAEAYLLFRDAGAEVVVASPLGGQAPTARPPEGDASWERFRRDSRARDDLADTVRLDQVYGGDFSGVLIVAAHGALTDLARDSRAAGLVWELLAAGRPVALVGHACAVLAGDPLIAARKVTGPSQLEDEQALAAADRPATALWAQLVGAGARYSAGPAWQAHVVEDGGLITGQNPQSIGPAAAALLLAIPRR